MGILCFSFFAIKVDLNYSNTSPVQKPKIMDFNAKISYKSSSAVSTLTNNKYTLNFSTYFGGSNTDNFISNGITIDSNGNIYMTGYTKSSDFPTKNAYNSTYGGGVSFGDAFVAKFNSTGYLLFSTYFGGSNDDEGNGIAVDNYGNIYITGATSSSNFPTKNAYQPSIKSSSIACFLAKFDSNGALLFSTFLGNSNNNDCFSLAIDTSGNSYVTGYTTSSSFPLKNAYNSTYGGGGSQDAFVAKFDPLGMLVFSTYLGGSGNDQGSGIAVDSNRNIYVTGSTTSSNFPTKSAYQATYGGGSFDGFLTEYNSTGFLSFSTYLGGSSSDIPFDMAVDSNGNSYITGSTSSSNFPTKNAYNATYGGNGVDDAFLTKFYANHTVAFSTYLGGSNVDDSFGITVDANGNSYIAGDTASSNFPTKNAYNATYGTNYDAFVAMFNKTGNLVFSTYLGGTGTDYGYDIGVDSNGNIYTTGYTESSNFPIKNSYYATNNGGGDIFLTKFTNPNPPSPPQSSTSSSASVSSTGTIPTSTTPTGSSPSLFDTTLFTNPLFDGILIIAILSLFSNLILVLRRRK